MMETYFEMKYYTEFIIPIIILALAVIFFIVYAIYDKFCEWNKKRQDKYEQYLEERENKRK